MLNMVRYRFDDNDEPQHKHVIWAWARGFVQYRGCFATIAAALSNHVRADLRLIGDRPTILYWMRFYPAADVSSWRRGARYRVGTAFSPANGTLGGPPVGFSRIIPFAVVSNFRPEDICGYASLVDCASLVLLGGAIR